MYCSADVIIKFINIVKYEPEWNVLDGGLREDGLRVCDIAGGSIATCVADKIITTGSGTICLCDIAYNFSYIKRVKVD